MSDDVFAADQGSVSALDALVGEGKKFADAEALAKGKAQADEHISTVEQENATLKEQLEAATLAAGKTAPVEELLAAIKEANTTQQSSEGGQTMSADELQDVIKSVLQTEKSAETKATNRAKGNALVLKAVDGDVEAARALVAERAGTLGMTPAQLAELSEDSPEAFATLIDPKTSTPSSGSPTSLPHVNVEGLNQDSRPLEVEGFKTKAWFDAKRKEVGHVKYINDPSIQGELTRSMNGLGERFNN